MLTKAGVAVAIVALAISSSGALAGPGGSSADDARVQPGQQPSFDARIDRFANPERSPADRRSPTPDGLAPAGAPGPGSFPRSFLIPGTNTSVRIGGFVDTTGGSRFGQ